MLKIALAALIFLSASAARAECVRWPEIGKTTAQKLKAYKALIAEEERVKAQYPACRRDLYGQQGDECEKACSAQK